MKYVIPLYLIILSSCTIGPRDTNHEAEWRKWSNQLKDLVSKIQSKPNQYSIGNNDFPKGFDYPFDDGFSIQHYGKGNNEPIKPDTLTIFFYTDRELMDHFSAFIYTNDPKEIQKLDHQTNQYNNDDDVKLENNWYYIND